MCKMQRRFLKTGHQDFWAVSIIQTYRLIESKCLRMISVDVWEARKHTIKNIQKEKSFSKGGGGGSMPQLEERLGSG